MEDTMVYKVHMNLSGRMTQLPDSQKLFGALMYLLSESETPKAASAFTFGIKNKEFYFALSDVIPLGYLPSPQVYLQEKTANQSLESEGNTKALYNAIKKKRFIKEEQWDQVFRKPDSLLKLYPYVTIDVSGQIHASIDSLQYHLPGLNPNLYAVSEALALEMKEKEDNARAKRPVKDFYFYMAMEKCAANDKLREVLDRAFLGKRPFFLGPGRSQGLNLFTIQDITLSPISLKKKAKSYLNMGMLLPQKIDFRRSYIKLFTSERRPFCRQEGWNRDCRKQFISFIEKGSILYLKEGIEKAGESKMIPSELFENGSIVFGNAFLYPLDDRGRCIE